MDIEPRGLGRFNPEAHSLIRKLKGFDNLAAKGLYAALDTLTISLLQVGRLTMNLQDDSRYGTQLSLSMIGFYAIARFLVDRKVKNWTKHK